MRRVVFGLVLSLLLPAAAFALTHEKETEEESAWRRVLVKMPDYPSDRNLRALDPALMGGTHDYFVDLASLAVRPPHVVHYTVVIRSQTGAENVFYEGLSCRTWEYRTYAFGASGKRLRPMSDNGWRQVSASGPRRYHRVLLEKYLCDPNRFALKRKQMVERLENRWDSSWDMQPGDR